MDPYPSSSLSHEVSSISMMCCPRADPKGTGYGRTLVCNWNTRVIIILSKKLVALARSVNADEWSWKSGANPKFYKYAHPLTSATTLTWSQVSKQ